MKDGGFVAYVMLYLSDSDTHGCFTSNGEFEPCDSKAGGFGLTDKGGFGAPFELCDPMSERLPELVW